MKIKNRLSVRPQANPDGGIETLTDDAGHLSLYWSAKRVPAVCGLHIQLQKMIALGQADVLCAVCKNVYAAVGGEAVLTALVHDGADTALKA